MRYVAALLAALGAGTVLYFAIDGGDEPMRPDGPAPRPNLVVVMTDDMPVSMFETEGMPFTTEFFADGTVFKEGIAAAPLCCPSRAGFLTGRYSHNHGVVENTEGYATLEKANQTFPVALQDGGYRTGLIGKFLNGYEPVAGAEPAPGFDSWFAIYGSADYFGFQVSDQGELREESGYSTEVFASKAIDFTKEAARDDVPFFLWLSLNAPHTVLEGSPPPCDGVNAQPPDAAAFERWANEPLPRPPSFDEPDVSDKPSLAAGPSPLSRQDLATATQQWRCARASLAAADLEIERFVTALAEQNQLEDTVFVFLSDNGYYNGEHRLTGDKRLPLEPALGIPMAIRLGAELRQGSDPPASVDELVSQVDLAPTLLDFAGAEQCKGCAAIDGRSLRPLLEGRPGWPSDRAIPFALAEGWTYRALRTPGELYMELDATRSTTFDSPVPELYDLNADPDQLEAITDPADPRVGEMAERLELLSGCAGISGRDEPSGDAPFCE